MAHPIVYGPAGSTYVWSPRLALAEKGVTHELVEVRFGGHREEPHLSRHPFAKVPAFTIGHLKAEHGPNTPNTAAGARAELRSAAEGSLAEDRSQRIGPSMKTIPRARGLVLAAQFLK
jgi:glutathione S-transferase-like protein